MYDIKKRPLGIYEKALPNDFTWLEKMQAAKQAGFDYIEISVDESDERLARLDWSDEQIEVIRSYMKETGIIIPSMCLRGHRRFPFGSKNKEIRDKAFEIMEKGIILAQKLGVRVIQLATYDVYYEESDEEMREISLLENIQRENLTAIELAWAYKGIIDNLDIRQEDLAKKIGKSRSHITNTLGLLNLPEDVQKKILDGEISMGHARVLSKMNDEDEVTDLANKVIEDNISVHELEEISKKEEIKKRMPITRRKMDTDYFHIENELRDILGTKVKVDNKKVSIYFENVNDLNRILEIMNIEIK